MSNKPDDSTAAATERFLFGCGIFVFALIAVWALFFVPMNMDEAGIYHVLDCVSYPFAPLHVFRESCLQQNDLHTPFGLTIREPGWYSGLWPSIIYAPVYFLFRAPGGQYAFGLAFLVAFAFLLGRRTARPWLGCAITLAFFPFVFQFIHDTGPVKYAMLMFPLGALFLDKILRAPDPAPYGYATGWAVLLLCAVEEKPFFLYLLPSLVLFVLALTAGDRKPKDAVAAIRKSGDAIFLAAVLTFLGTLVLLISVNAHGARYINWLMDLAQKGHDFGDWLGALFEFFFYWPSYAHYLLDLPPGGVVLKILTIMFVAVCAGLLISERFSVFRLRWGLLGLSFLVMLVIFGFLRNTWAGHHFVFLWVPLIMLFADLAAALPPVSAMALTAAFFALNLLSLADATQAKPPAYNSFDRTAIFHFFAEDARAGRSIVNFSSWGGYFIQSLYGPENQLVTYAEPYGPAPNGLPLTPQDAGALLNLAQKTGRTLYNVCFGATCSADSLNAAFMGKARFEDALPGLTEWHVFEAAPPGGRK